MINIVRTIKAESSDDLIRIRYLNDLHVGYKYVDYKKIERDVEEIKNDPNMYWIGGGDYGEFIDYKDRRFKGDEVANFVLGSGDIVQTQLDYLDSLFVPIRGKCLGLIEGNHEGSISKSTGRDVSKEIEKMVGAKLLGWRGFITLRFMVFGKTRHSTIIYADHGHGSARTAGGHVGMLERSFRSYDADIILVGHRHQRYDIESIQIAPCGASIKRRIRYAALCGAYRGTCIPGIPERSYEAVAGYEPSVPGGYVVNIMPVKKKIALVKDLV